MKLRIGPILRTDSYKFSHWKQIPDDQETAYSYEESRGGMFAEIPWLGMSYVLQEYFQDPITYEDVDYAQERVGKHFGRDDVFNRDGFLRIVEYHGGLWPLRIRSAPEGLVIPTRNVLLTAESTDKKLPWVGQYVEPLLMRPWYPTTVGATSRESKKIILEYLIKTGTPETINHRLVDFGYRGVSSDESACIGGFAHATNFEVSDTFVANEFASYYYGADMATYGIPAMEHSTVMAWGEMHESEAYQNMIRTYGTKGTYAIVGDTHNIFNAVENIFGKELRAEILELDGVLVVRPDSSVPHEIVRQVIEGLDKNFGHTIHEKGYKVLNKVRVIQGDGIDAQEIRLILEALRVRGWSADNVSYGSGGSLLQKVNRDTNSFAIKLSSLERNGRRYDVSKQPITDNNKRSKAGRLKLIRDGNTFSTVPASAIGHDILETVYENGKILVHPTLDEIRERCKVWGSDGKLY